MSDDFFDNKPDPPAPNAIAVWIDQELSKDIGAALNKKALDVLWDAYRIDKSEWLRVTVVLRKHKVYTEVLKAVEALEARANGANNGKSRRVVVPVEDPKDKRPIIVIGEEEHKVNDQAVKALAKLELYQKLHRLVEVRASGVKRHRGVQLREESIQIVPVGQGRLREHLCRAIRWRKSSTEDGVTKLLKAHPPTWCFSSIHDREGDWPGIRVLDSVTETPLLRPDGTILDKPGYDSDTGILYRPNRDYPKIATQPSKSDAEAAAQKLLAIVSDFPFEEPSHITAWLASLLTPFARFAYHGPTPMFVIDANTRGIGKTLLAQLVGDIVLGRDMMTMAHVRDEEEERKRVTSIAISGERLVLIDNVTGAVGSAALDNALTSTTWSDRILGKTGLVTAELFVCWYLTANNVEFRGDTIRRCLHIRLRTHIERPEERSGFAHPDLRRWVRDNRPELVAAALTVLRAYFSAGAPKLEITPWGSYEGWSSVVRNVVCWLGLKDPGESRKHLAALADTETDSFRLLMLGWRALAATHGMALWDKPGAPMGLTASQVIDEVEEQERHPSRVAPAGLEAIREALNTLLRKRSARSLGVTLRHRLESTIDDMCFIRQRHTTSNVTLWCVVAAPEYAPRK